MANLVLGPMLRHVSDTTATIWVETDAACTVEVLGHRASTFTVADHHYALVIVEGLTPGTITPYRGPPRRRDVLAAARRAVPGQRDPHPRWRAAADPVRFVPHRRAARTPVVARVRSRRPGPRRRCRLGPRTADAASSHPTNGPTCSCSSATRSTPTTRRRRPAPRSPDGAATSSDDDRYPPLDDVADFEEYTWLYHEAWLPEVERWMLSVVPSAMIFDDHDMIDDWNTSSSWLDDIRRQPWWKDRAVGGFMSYWVYQHLGNLSPKEIRAEGMLDTFVGLGDATDRPDGVGGGGGASVGRARRLPVQLLPRPRPGEAGRDRQSHRAGAGTRREERWSTTTSGRGSSSTPTSNASTSCWRRPYRCNMPGGLHDLEQWNERLCNGAWGKPFASARRADPPRRRPRGLVGVPRQLSSLDGPRPRRRHAACAARSRSAGDGDDPVRRRALQLPITRLGSPTSPVVRRR